MGYARFKKIAVCPDICKRAAFTLIELLVALLIFSVIAAGIYSAFGAGIFATKRLGSALDNYRNTAVILDFMANKIASFVPSEKVVFEGTADKIIFLSDVETDGRYDLKKTSFYLDDSTGSLIQSEEGVKSVLEPDENKKEISTEELSADIKSLQFKYLCKKSDSQKEYEWSENFDPKNMISCQAVQISVSDSPGGKKTLYLYASAKK